MAYSLPTVKISKNGQSLDSIAKANGIKDGNTIWGHKKNQKLAKLRGDPKRLKKGDIVVLPMPKAYKKAIDDLVVEYAKNIIRVSTFRKGVAAELANAENNLKQLSKIRATILKFQDTQIAELDDAADLALEKRAQADFIQNVLSVHKSLIKLGVKGAAQTGKLGLTLKKSADNIDNIKAMSTLAKYLKTSGYMGKISAGWSPAVDIALDVARGASNFAVDMGADASSAQSSFGKAIKFLDDATSITHYLWVGTRAAMTGKLSWDSIEKDKKKTIKKLHGKVRDALGWVLDTENRNKKLISGHRAQIKALDRDLAAMQKHITRLIALSKL